MARLVQLLVRDPSGAVWTLDIATGESVATEANHAYRFGANGKATNFPSGTTIQKAGKDLKIRFADGEEVTLTDWTSTAGASLATRGARVLDSSGPASERDGELASGEPASGEVVAASDAPPIGSEPTPGPSKASSGVTDAAAGAVPSSAQGAVPTAASAPPPPAPPVAAPASGGGVSMTGILGGLAGVAVLGAAAGGGGGGSSSGSAPPTPVSAAPTGVALAMASDSGVTGDGITNDTTPTISGRAEANAAITLRNSSGTTVASATADASGTWSATPASALPGGANTLQIVANRGGGAGDSAATPFTVTIDSAAPAAPFARLDPTSDSGVTGDNRTNDATPTLSGTGTAGDTIRVTVPGGAVLTTTVAADGSWTVTPTVALAAVANAISITAVDVAGNASPATALSVTVDTTAPAAPVVALDASSDSGVVGDNRTNDTTPTISGTGTAGDTIRVTLPGGTVLTTNVASNGTWSATPTTPLSSGANALSVTAVDAAGNVSAVTPLNLTIVTTGPAAPAAQLAVASDSGTVGDNLTNDTTPTISGTGAAGDTIRVTLPGGTVLTTTVASNGTWSATPTSALTSGPNTISVTATDAAANVSAATTLTVVIDATPPAAPVPALSAASDSGTLGDNRTNDTTPTISGTGAAGDTIRVTLPGGTVLTTTVASNGSWSVTPTTALASGANLISATATDPAGNVSTAGSLTVTVDTTAPGAPVAQLAAASDTGTTGDNRTSDNTPTITGTGVAGDTIRVDLPGGVTLTTTVATNGSWSVTPATALADGLNALSITAVDAAGNVSVATPLSLTIDTSAPSAPAITVPEGPVVTQGENADGIAVVVTGSFTTGDTVAVLVTRPDSSTTTVSRVVTAGEVTAGSATVTIPSQSQQGAYVVRAAVTDSAGNTGAASASAAITLDTQGPGAPTLTIGEAADGFVNEVEATSGGGVPVLVTLPTGALAGDTITVTVDRPTGADSVLTYVIQPADVSGGSASVLIPTAVLATNGAYAVEATVTDGNGNVGATSPDVDFTVDRTAPGAPSAPNMTAATDSGASNSDNLTSNPTPVFTGNGATSGNTVQLVDTDGVTVVGSATATGGGAWTITATALAAGPHTLTARQLDVAGNASTLSTSLNVTIDTQGPTFASPVAVNEGFASVVLSPVTLAAADNVSAPAALDVTAASFVSATGFVAGDFSIVVSAGQATITRAPGAVDKNGSAVFAVTMVDAAGNATLQNVTLGVTAVNDAPSGTTASVVTGFNTPLVLGTATFGFGDVLDSPANVLASVRISTLPVAGQLTLAAAPVTAGQDIPVAQLAAGQLVFTPTLGGSGTAYASFTFQVRDNGGITNGGIDLDPTPNTLTIDVAPFFLLSDDGEPLTPSLLGEPGGDLLALVLEDDGTLTMDAGPSPPAPLEPPSPMPGGEMTVGDDLLSPLLTVSGGTFSNLA